MANEVSFERGTELTTMQHSSAAGQFVGPVREATEPDTNQNDENTADRNDECDDGNNDWDAESDDQDSHIAREKQERESRIALLEQLPAYPKVEGCGCAVTNFHMHPWRYRTPWDEGPDSRKFSEEETEEIQGFIYQDRFAIAKKIEEDAFIAEMQQRHQDFKLKQIMKRQQREHVFSHQLWVSTYVYTSTQKCTLNDLALWPRSNTFVNRPSIPLPQIPQPSD